MLENQIYSIESANINQETLNAMKNAGKAMKDIHGNLTIDKIDNIMYAIICRSLPPFCHASLLRCVHFADANPY
jgi:hypothetical protein